MKEPLVVSDHASKIVRQFLIISENLHHLKQLFYCCDKKANEQL